jgi:hypothetical protein
MFVTKDPNKAFINLGKLGLTASVPEDELTERAKKTAHYVWVHARSPQNEVRRFSKVFSLQAC